jgi:hypothetical protein
VEDAINRDHTARILVEDGIRELPHKAPPIVFVDDSVQLGAAEDLLGASIDAAQEFLAQADPPTFIPGIGFGDILFGFGATMSSAAIAAFHPTLNLFPTQARGGVLQQVGLPSGELFLLPVVDRHILRRGREVIPEILDELKFLRGAQVKDRRNIRAHPDLSLFKTELFVDEFAKDQFPIPQDLRQVDYHPAASTMDCPRHRSIPIGGRASPNDCARMHFRRLPLWYADPDSLPGLDDPKIKQ